MRVGCGSIARVRAVFLSAGDQEIAEYDAAGVLVRRFVWGAGLDDLVATIGTTGCAARRRLHQADGLGSVVAVTDRNGVVEERFAYTPYGVGDSLAGTSPWRFTGRRQDPETGLYYLRARDYAPLLGRFVQLDPIGMQGGLNLYAYVENDPLNRMDPLGLQNSIWDQYRGPIDPGLFQRYRSPDGILAGAAGAPSIAAYNSGQSIVPTKSEIYSFASALAFLAGQPALGYALASGAAAQKALDFVTGASSSAQTIAGTGVDVATSFIPGMQGAITNLLAGRFVDILSGALNTRPEVRMESGSYGASINKLSPDDPSWNPPGSNVYIGRAIRSGLK